MNDIIAHPDKVAKVVPTAKALAFGTYDWNLIARNMRILFGRMFEKP